MNQQPLFRRRAMVCSGSILGGACLLNTTIAQGIIAIAQEVELVDEPTRGYYGQYDVANFGPPALRNAKREFNFPNDVEIKADLNYGIDISHHTDEVPWSDLKHSKVNYIYIKASQSRNGRDGKFVEFWQEAAKSEVPYGAYHFLTAGVPGRVQGEYFLKRLSEVGGLSRGQLQPVVDLEWDTYGLHFKTVILGKTSHGNLIYKDYWDDISKPEIVATVNDCVAAIHSAAGQMAIKPIIYTNRSWWESHIPAGTVFAGCSIWISDYRQQSYDMQSPRSVPKHDYYIWQFTDKAHINIHGKRYGPYDSNKLVLSKIDRIIIA